MIAQLDDLNDKGLNRKSDHLKSGSEFVLADEGQMRSLENVPDGEKSPASPTADAAAASMPPRCWTEVRHQGSVYYHKELTGETSWTKPEEHLIIRPPPPPALPQPEDSAAPSPLNAPPYVSLPLPCWRIMEYQGAVYYVNKLTGESSWIMPPYHLVIKEGTSVEPVATGAPSVSMPPMGVPCWKRLAYQGTVYYFNELTGESSWEKPEDRLMIEAPPVPTLPSPPCWREVISVDGVYYHNEREGWSSWTRPEEHLILAIGDPSAAPTELAPSGPLTTVRIKPVPKVPPLLPKHIHNIPANPTRLPPPHFHLQPTHAPPTTPTLHPLLAARPTPTPFSTRPKADRDTLHSLMKQHCISLRVPTGVAGRHVPKMGFHTDKKTGAE